MEALKRTLLMASQDDVIDLQALNLREDEASAQGTQAVRYLVRRLQEAQSNPALDPTVQALMHSHIAEPSHRHKSPESEQVTRKWRKDEPMKEDWRSLLHKRLLKNDDLLIL